MTQLFINGREAALPSDFSFSLTEENPYFTKSSEYSGEITLQLAGCAANLAIFGSLNRKDVSRRKTTYTARLMCNNRCMLDGTATVTGYNDTSVSIQLLGGNADVNYRSQFEKLYIDELDLGVLKFGNLTFNSISDIDNAFENSLTKAQREELIFGKHLQSEYCFVPVGIMGETDGDDKHPVANNFFRVQTDSSVCYPCCRSEFVAAGYEAATYNSNKSNCRWFVPQPHLAYMIERIVKALGYTLSEFNWKTDEILSVMHICNGNQTVKYAEMLPHWTVNQFMEEVENFTGYVFCFEPRTKEVRIISRASYFANTSAIGNVVDAFSVSIDEEQTSDISNANVGFDADSDNFGIRYKFTDELTEKCDIRDNISAATFFAGSTETTVKMGTLVRESTGHHYYYNGTDPVDCNQFRDLVREEDADEVKLKIIPATLKEKSIMLSWINGDMDCSGVEPGYVKVVLNCLSSAALIPHTVQYDKEVFNYININNVIEGEEELEDTDADTSGLLRVMFWKGYAGGSIENCMAAQYFRYYSEGLEYYITNLYAAQPWLLKWSDGQRIFKNSLVLHHLDGDKTLYDLSIGTSSIVKTTETFEIQCISNEVIPVHNIFVFNGHRWAIVSAEYTVSNLGCEPLVTLTCYRVDSRVEDEQGGGGGDVPTVVVPQRMEIDVDIDDGSYEITAKSDADVELGTPILGELLAITNVKAFDERSHEITITPGNLKVSVDGEVKYNQVYDNTSINIDLGTGRFLVTFEQQFTYEGASYTMTAKLYLNGN